MSQHQQLPLAVHLPDDETFSSFFTSGSESLVEELRQYVKGNAGEKGMYLFGQQGVGKSHLLHASCAYAASIKKTSLCLSFSELQQLSVEVLDGLESIDLICLDDIDLIAGKKDWEVGVFDLYNRMTEQQKQLIITGNDSVSQLKLALPDLVSRLNWGLSQQVKPLDEAIRIQALQHRARVRGLDLSDDTGRYLFNHYSRDLKSLLPLLDRLDKASIAEQRKLTIPFIKSVLS